MIRDRMESLSHSADNIGTNTVSQEAALTSIAISLKRFVDMVEKADEEARKPKIELMPEGYISDQDHRRFIRESIKRDGANWQRIVDGLWGCDGTAGLLELLNPLQVRNNY